MASEHNAPLTNHLANLANIDGTLSAFSSDPRPLRHNLPAHLTPTVGRQQEVRQLYQQLLDPACRLLTLTGPGGIGKTRLALTVAQQLVAAQINPIFSDGVYLAQFEGISQGSLVVAALAAALDFSFAGSPQATTQLIDYLRNKRLLLLLDNFEHLIEQSELLVTILQQAPAVKLLVTSRERLSCAGEWVVEVDGLPVPQMPEPSQANEYAAIQLFIQRAQAVQLTFDYTRQFSALVQICQQLAGLPLGIELAAATVKDYTCEQIAQGLQQSLDFLASRMRNVPERHRTLRAMFEQSWALLTPDQQDTFQRLAVFAGSFTATAAAAVSEADLAALSILADKSLLQRLPAPDGASANVLRYKMHPAIQQFAGEKLTASAAPATTLYERHCAYYSGWLAEQAPLLDSVQVVAAVQAVNTELDNLSAAWRYAVSQANPTWLGQSLPGLARYFVLRGPLSEWQTDLEAALAATRSVSPQSEALNCQLQAELARVLNERGLYEQALAATQQVIDQAQRNRLPAEEALGHLQKGRAFYFLARYEEAIKPLTQAFDLAQSAKARSTQAAAHHLLGTTRLYRGDPTGTAHYEEAVRLYHELGATLDELRVRYSQAVVLFFTGDYVHAKMIYEECLKGYRTLDDRRSVGLLLNNLGAVYTQLGEYAQAKQYYEEGLALKRRLGDRPYESLILANLGLLAYNSESFEEATTYCRAAFQISRELGERVTTAYAQTCLGYALLGMGWLAEASDVFGEAFQLRQVLGQQAQALEPLAGLAATYLALGNISQAQRFVEKILPQLPSVTGEGIIEPFRIFLVCYQVLHASQDGRASDVLLMAHQALHARANKIDDADLRHSFLHKITVHQQLQTAIAQAPAARQPEQTQQWRQRLDQHMNLVDDIEALLRQEPGDPPAN